jgi:hypothetical protein
MGDASYQMISLFFGGAQPISTDRFAKKNIQIEEVLSTPPIPG